MNVMRNIRKRNSVWPIHRIVSPTIMALTTALKIWLIVLVETRRVKPKTMTMISNTVDVPVRCQGVLTTGTALPVQQCLTSALNQNIRVMMTTNMLMDLVVTMSLV